MPFTVTPADGSTVTNITATNPVILTVEEGYAEIEIISKDDIKFTKDGADYCGILRSGSGPAVEIKPADDIISAGVYQLVINAGAICWYNNNDFSNPIDNPEQLVYTYTIEGNGGETAYELPFNVSPEDGSTLSSLSMVTFTMKEGQPYSEFDVNTKDDIYFMHNGVRYTASCEGGSELIIIPENEITEAGEWQLIIDKYAIYWASADYSAYSDNEEKIVFTYNIEGNGETPADYPFKVMEPEGETVNSLYYALLELDSESGFTSFIVNDPAGIYFTKDGDIYTTTDSYASGRELNIDPDNFITDSGNYALVIKAGAISWTNGSDVVDLPADFVVNFTVEAAEATEAPVYLIPEEGSTVSELGTVTISLIPDLGYDYIDIDGYGVAILDEDYNRCGTVSLYQDPSDYTSYTLTIKNNEGAPITEAGTYFLCFDEYALNCYNDNYDPYYCNFEPLFYSFTVVPAAAPVVYDVIPSDYKPTDGSVIDFDSRDLSDIILYVEEGIEPAEGAMAQLIFALDPENVVTAPIEKVRYMNQLRITFAPAQYSGEYTVYIPEGSFGDAAWLEDHEYGHSNPSIELHYTLINAASSIAEYDLVPNVVPAMSNYQAFSIMFEQTDTEIMAGATATLECIEAKYMQTADIKSLGHGMFTVEFAEAPTESGTYVFTVARGAFGDEDYISTDGFKGKASKEISIAYEIKTTGVESISVDAAAEGVYNLIGVKVADTLENLPAGIYIVNGKKVVVK